VKLTALAAAVASTDPHLAIVLAAWAILTEPVRANIAAIAKATPAVAPGTNPIP